MSTPMFVLSVDVKGIECEVRINDVRQYRKRDGTPTRFSGRLNPWLLPGNNAISIVARAAGVNVPAAGSPAADGERVLEVSVTHAMQGQPSEGAPVLFTFKADAAQLAALGSSPTSLALQNFVVSALPWSIPWQNLQQGAFVRSDVLAWVRDYAAMLRRRDLQALIAANKLRMAVMSNSLGLSTADLTASLEGRLADVDPAQWTLAPDSAIVLGEEGAGRFCRVETATGGPVIFVKRDGREAGFTFLLARSSGQLWVIA